MAYKMCESRSPNVTNKLSLQQPQVKKFIYLQQPHSQFHKSESKVLGYLSVSAYKHMHKIGQEALGLTAEAPYLRDPLHILTSTGVIPELPGKVLKTSLPMRSLGLASSEYFPIDIFLSQ